MDKKNIKWLFLLFGILLIITIYSTVNMIELKRYNSERDKAILNYVYNSCINDIQFAIERLEKDTNENLNIIEQLEMIQRSSHTAVLLLDNVEYKQSSVEFFRGISQYADIQLKNYYREQANEMIDTNLKKNITELDHVITYVRENRDLILKNLTEADIVFNNLIDEKINNYPDNEIIELYEFYK